MNKVVFIFEYYFPLFSMYFFLIFVECFAQCRDDYNDVNIVNK